MVNMLQKFTNDLQDFQATEELVTLPSNIFPLKDFQSDESGAPVYVPQDYTHLFVTPLHLAAYSGKDEVVQLLSAFWETSLHLNIGPTTPLSYRSSTGIAARQSCYRSVALLYVASLAQLVYMLQQDRECWPRFGVSSESMT